MGFTEGAGPQESPEFNNSPQTTTDLNRLRDLALERGNRFVLTTAERSALSGDLPYEGMEVFDLDLESTVIYRGGAWKRVVSFRSFTLGRSGMTDGSLFFQVMTEDTAKDTEPAFSYAYVGSGGDNGKLTPEAGIYSLSVRLHPGSAATGATYAQIRSTAELLARGSVAVNADPWATPAAIFRADGTVGFWVEMSKTTGGTHTAFGELKIVRLGDL